MKTQLRSAVFILLSLFATITNAQVYELSTSGSKAVITGTSSLHDWEVDVTKFSSGFRLTSDGNNVKTIDNVTFSCKAKDLKSESSLMDKKTHEALKANDFPEIKFTGTSVTSQVTDGNSMKGTLKGMLSLAGQNHEISVPFNGTLTGNGVSIESSSEITFSSFGLDPPTAMLGTLKTGDKVKVTFNLQYSQKGQ